MAFARVSPVGSEINDAEEATNNDQAIAANEAIFRLLYHQPLLCATPMDFLDAAVLAARYGCVDAVKDGLAAAILKASLGTTLFQDNPWAILNAACCLNDEALFSEALIHVVGRGGAGGCKCPPPGVQDLVNKHFAELEDQVNRHWQEVLS